MPRERVTLIGRFGVELRRVRFLAETGQHVLVIAPRKNFTVQARKKYRITGRLSPSAVAEGFLAMKADEIELMTE